MKVVKIFIIVINIILMINSIHFGIFGIIPLFKKRKEEPKIDNKKHKFMILIAARNEEKVIGNLIDSLKKQDYPKDLYTICVIPNNCTDNTKKIALNKKCMVIEPNIKTKTKGEVLNFTFNYLKNEDFDTYVIFDADNIAEKDFLKQMNNKLNKGYKVVQGFRDTKNLYDSYISSCYALFFYLQILFVYESRSRIGKNSMINGTGYVIAKELVDKLPKFKTLTEDIELTCLAILNGEKVGYEKKACFYDEQVTTFKTSITQRKRWVGGCMQVFKEYYKDVVTKLLKKPSFELIDLYQILYLPFNQVLAFIFLILSLCFIMPINLFLVSLLVGYIGEVIITVVLVIYYKKNLNKMWFAILYFPIFNITWLPLYLYSIFKTNSNWEEIKHTKNIKIEDLGGNA